MGTTPGEEAQRAAAPHCEFMLELRTSCPIETNTVAGLEDNREGFQLG